MSRGTDYDKMMQCVTGNFYRPGRIQAITNALIAVRKVYLQPEQLLRSRAMQAPVLSAQQFLQLMSFVGRGQQAIAGATESVAAAARASEIAAWLAGPALSAPKPGTASSKLFVEAGDVVRRFGDTNLVKSDEITIGEIYDCVMQLCREAQPERELDLLRRRKDFPKPWRQDRGPRRNVVCYSRRSESTSVENFLQNLIPKIP